MKIIGINNFIKQLIKNSSINNNKYSKSSKCFIINEKMNQLARNFLE